MTESPDYQAIAYAEMADSRACRCDPPGSGEEFCTGHCVLAARIRDLEIQVTQLTRERDCARRLWTELGQATPPGRRDLLALLDQVADWGDATFPGSTWDAKGRHLVDEAKEAWQSEGNGEELADVAFILAHMVRQGRIDLYAEIERKLAICKARTWLPPDEYGVVRHAPGER